MNRTRTDLISISSFVCALFLTACGPKPPASQPAQPASQPTAAAAPQPVEELPPAPTGPVAAPATTAMSLRIEGLGPTVEAVRAQLAPLGANIPPASALQQLIASQLGFKTGQSLDLSRPAGAIVDAQGGLMGGVPKFAFWIGTTSLAALRQDLPPATSGHGFEVPDAIAAFVQVAEAVPGGVAFSSDADYLNTVRGFIASELAKPAAAPAIEASVDVDHLAEQFGPMAEAAAPEEARPFTTKAFDVMKTVDTAVLTYRPDPNVMRMTVDLIPVTGSQFATLLASHAPAAPVPSGSAIPSDFPIQGIAGFSPDTLIALQDMFSSLITDPAIIDIQKQLTALSPGAYSFGASVGGDLPEIVVVTAYTDSAKAQALSEQLATKSKGLSAIFSGMSADTKDITLKLAKNAARVGGQKADRLDITAKGKKYVEYFACPPGNCVMSMAPTDARAKALLGEALAGLGGKGTPMLQRPGVKETAALLGDTSHGFTYVDLIGLLDRVAAQHAAEAAGPKAKKPAAPVAASGKPGMGVSWSATGNALTLTSAISIATLQQVKEQGEKMEEMGEGADEEGAEGGEEAKPAVPEEATPPAKAPKSPAAKTPAKPKK